MVRTMVHTLQGSLPEDGTVGGGDWGGLALAAMGLDGLEGGRSDGDVALGDGECARRHPFTGI